MGLSVVVPSKKIENLVPCVRALYRHEPSARVIVMDDGLDWLSCPEDFCLRRSDILVRCLAPFNYSRNCNSGMRCADYDDVVLLNDDALLKTPGGFTELQQVVRSRPEIGILSAVMYTVGNVNQMPARYGIREETHRLCFVAVFIPRSTIERVGYLDEDFDCYSHQDDDYSLRVLKAGLKLAVSDYCRVDHETLVPTFRGPGGNADEQPGQLIFERKWGYV
jgi:O-antigen biosynthesis protein